MLTREQKIALIIPALQSQDNLLLLLRVLITNNLPIIEEIKLDTMITVLGLTPPQE